MKNNIKFFLDEYLYATDVLAIQFCQKHFKSAEDMFWVGDEIGGVMSIGDYFFSMNDIVEFTKYKYSTKKMFEYYNYALEIEMYNSDIEMYPLKAFLKKEKTKICIRDYQKLIK